MKRRLAASAAGILAAALVIPWAARGCRARSAPGVPAELLTAASTFPPPSTELPQAVPLEPLLVADAPDRLAILQPTEAAENLRPGQPLTIRFNRPMVEGAAVGKPLDPTPIVFVPHVAGRATWTSRSTLSFEAERSTWTKTPSARLRLAPELRSLAGEALVDPIEHVVVFDGGPQLQGQLGRDRLVAGEPIRLSFSGKVDALTLGPGLMVYEIDGGRRMIPFSLTTSPKDAQGLTRVELAMRSALEPGARFAVAVAPPLSYGGSSPRVLEMELAPRPRIEGIDCPEGATSSSACSFDAPPGRIVDIGESLRLLATEPLAQIPAGAIQVSPPMAELAVKVEGERTIVITGAFEPAQVYEVRVGDLRDAGDHLLARTPPLAVRSAGRAPEIRVAGGRLTFEREAEATLPLAGIHVDRGVARTVAISAGHELVAAASPERLFADDREGAFTSTSLPSLLPEARPNRWGRTRLRWSELERGQASMAALSLVPDVAAPSDAARVTTFVQRTDLGLDARVLHDGVLTWVTSIETAKPLAGARVSVGDALGERLGVATTDADGVAWLAVPDAERNARGVVVGATLGDDRAVMVVDPRTAMGPRHFGVAPGDASATGPGVVASLFTDRGIVRPGEVVHAKALLRADHEGQLDGPPIAAVQLVLLGPDGDAPIAERTAPLSTFGTGDVDFPVGADAPPGTYRIEARVAAKPPANEDESDGGTAATDGTTTQASGTETPPNGEPTADESAKVATTSLGAVSFTVGEYRAPAFRVDLSAPPGDLVERDPIRVDVDAAYPFGSKAVGRPAHFTITREARAYPERWSGYAFGVEGASIDVGTMGAGDLTLDAEGRGAVTAPVTLGAALRGDAVVEVEVRDVSGASTSTRLTLPVFPATHEVGLREVPAWLDAGATLDVEAIVIGHDDAPVAGQTIDARITREGWHRYWEWVDRDGDGGDDAAAPQVRRTHTAEVVHRCRLTSTDAPVHCPFEPTRSGTYVLEATTRDERGRVTTASRRVYVAGKDEHPDRDPPGTKLTLTPKSETMTVGETAEMAFESPFPDAEVMLVVHRDGVLHRERRRVSAGGHVLRFPVTAQMAPNAFVSISLARPRTGPPGAKIDLDAPDLRVGLAEITVRPAAQPLTVLLEARSPTLAGSDVPIELTVRDASGRGVAAEVALYAVDEGTLRVTGYTSPDLRDGLFPRVAPGFAWEDLRRSLVSRAVEPLLPGAGGDGTDGAAARRLEQLDRFEPTPLWLPHVETDAQGHATAQLHLPERATEYRLMAVANDRGIGTGHAETQVTASMPLVVRPVLPAQVTVGDRFEAVAFVHETEGKARRVTVTPVVRGVTGAPFEVDVAAKGETRIGTWVDVPETRELGLELEVADGTARTTWRGVVPVAPRGRLSPTSAVGAIERERTLTLRVPERSSRPTTLTIASHPFVGFDAAVETLATTSDADTEATAASLLALAAYGRLDDGLRSSSLPRAEVEARAEQAISRLIARQTSDGGFGAYDATDPSDDYVTAFALHALSSAARVGWPVAGGPRRRARTYLGERARGTALLDAAPEGRGHDELAFALRVLTEEGEPQLERIEALFAQRERLTPFGLAELALALPEDDTRRLTLATHAVLVRYTRRDEVRPPSLLRWYDGSARTVGAVLESTSAIEALHDLAPDVASRLLLTRSTHDAAWGSTHETSFALSALAAYAAAFPDLGAVDAAVTLDGRAIPSLASGPRATTFTIPADVAPGDHELRLETAGTAWFAIDATEIVPLGDVDEVARGAGVALHRRLENAAGKPLEPGAHVKAGELVRVRLFLFTEDDAPPFVVVHDPIAGGFEPVDAANETTPREALSALLGMGPDDDVVDARAHHAVRSLDILRRRTFADGAARFDLPRAGSGLHELTYGVRAITPGTFVVRPAEVQALHARGFRARSAMSTLVVDP